MVSCLGDSVQIPRDLQSHFGYTNGEWPSEIDKELVTGYLGCLRLGDTKDFGIGKYFSPWTDRIRKSETLYNTASRVLYAFGSWGVRETAHFVGKSDDLKREIARLAESERFKYWAHAKADLPDVLELLP